MNTITTPRWRDGHLHLRHGKVMNDVAPYTSKYCSDALIMPNVGDGIISGPQVQEYKAECERALGSTCKPIMTIKLVPQTTPEMVKAAHAEGAQAIKVYPSMDDGSLMTTGSHGGITAKMFLDPPQQMLDSLAQAERLRMKTLWHGEFPDDEISIMDQEAEFLKVFENFVRRFPDMPQVLEHITTEAAVTVLDFLYGEGFKVAATITHHHLWMKYGLNDVMRPLAKPDWICMPIAKKAPDRRALLRAVKRPWSFSGTDSAPHDHTKKYCAGVCAGCFTAPHPEMLIQIFEEHNLLDFLVEFTNTRMQKFYELGEPEGQLTFVRQEWEVPGICGGIVPFLANRKLQWKLL